MNQTTSTLKKELLQCRNNQWSAEGLLDEVQRILEQNQQERAQIAQRIQQFEDAPKNNLVLELLETDRIFHLAHIRKVCVDYRLRFLDTHYFKNEIPSEAISEIHRLERQHQTQLNGFKIMAPSKAFALKNYDDPLLFAPLGNDYYYLVHQWGDDISTLRKWKFWSFKNLLNFVLVCVAVSLFLTWLTPQTPLSRQIEMAQIIVFLFAFKTVVAVAMYGYFMLGKRFNTSIWDSPYFNH